MQCSRSHCLEIKKTKCKKGTFDKIEKKVQKLLTMSLKQAFFKRNNSIVLQWLICRTIFIHKLLNRHLTTMVIYSVSSDIYITYIYTL